MIRDIFVIGECEMEPLIIHPVQQLRTKLYVQAILFTVLVMVCIVPLATFIGLDEGNAVLKTQVRRRGEDDVFIRARSTDVGQLLALGRVHHQVTGPAAFTNDLAPVDFGPWPEK